MISLFNKNTLLLSLLSMFFACGSISQKIGSHTDFINNPLVKLEKVAGDNQFDLVNSTLASPLEVRALDNKGEAMPNQEISFTIVKGNPILPQTAITNAEGIAKAELILGPDQQEVIIKANWHFGQRSVEFKVYGSTTILRVVKAPGYNDESNCVGEENTYDESFIVQLVDKDEQPITEVPINVSIENGSLDFAQFEESQNYSTSTNTGFVTFFVKSGTVRNDAYDDKVSVTLTVPSMTHVPHLTLNMDVTKQRGIKPISNLSQYSSILSDNTTFDFTVQVYGECFTKVAGKYVDFRLNLVTGCNYVEPVNPLSWAVFPPVLSDENGVANINIISSVSSGADGAAPTTIQVKATAYDETVRIIFLGHPANCLDD